MTTLAPTLALSVADEPEAEVEFENLYIDPVLSGVIAGVYFTPLQIVQIVNCAVALPTIFPGVMLPVGVKHLLKGMVGN